MFNLNNIKMKTLSDLFDLIKNETEMNAGKRIEYVFKIDTKYRWVSMYQRIGETDVYIFLEKSIDTLADIQLVYWIIWHEGRSHNLEIDINKLW